jgi:hypothetical protein
VSNINISSNAPTAIINTPSTSPTTFSAPRPEKRRKSKDESPSSFNGSNALTATGSGNSTVAANKEAAPVKKPKSVASPLGATSPVLLECPEQDCSKKYKHANGLKYHQSHAHGIISNADDDSLTAPDSPSQRSQSPPNANSVDSNFSQKINFESGNDSKVISETIPPKNVVNVDRPSSNASGENVSIADTNSSHPFTEAITKPSNSGVSTASSSTKQDTQGMLPGEKNISQKFQRKSSIFRETQYIEIYELFGPGANIQRFNERHDTATLNELLLTARKKWRKK